jgi:quinol monooxygenase YgiN
MFARIVTMRPKPNTVVQLTKVLEDQVLPTLRKQDGFQDEVCLISADTKKAVVISFWGRQEQADKYSVTAYPQILEAVKHLLEETPVAKSYEMLSSTFYKKADKATI